MIVEFVSHHITTNLYYLQLYTSNFNILHVSPKSLCVISGGPEYDEHNAETV
jgi:hypothetical protein